jgi:hypothetical protein
MSHHPATPSPAPAGPVPSGPRTDQHDDAIAQREQAEQKEVAGRHKNDGQMPHKGAR